VRDNVLEVKSEIRAIDLNDLSCISMNSTYIYIQSLLGRLQV